MVSEVVVISPQNLRDLVEDAVRAGVAEALQMLQKNHAREMTEREAAQYLGMAPATLRGWRCQKKGPRYHKSGHVIRYGRSDLDAWLAQSNVETIDSLEAGYGKAR